MATAIGLLIIYLFSATLYSLTYSRSDIFNVILDSEVQDTPYLADLPDGNSTCALKPPISADEAVRRVLEMTSFLDLPGDIFLELFCYLAFSTRHPVRISTLSRRLSILSRGKIYRNVHLVVPASPKLLDCGRPQTGPPPQQWAKTRNARVAAALCPRPRRLRLQHYLQSRPSAPS
ncbi:hypothetical protein AOQ84DRAFT_224368, partial [Glonium stellatum]